jgi:hypothetical protein
MAAPVLYGQTHMASGTTFPILVPDLRVEPSELISAAVDQAAQTYRDVGAHLLAQLRGDGLSNQGKIYAIYLLGELRAVGSVKDLLERIDLKAEKVDFKGAIGRWGPYPSQEALVKIGAPAVHAVLDTLSQESDDLRRKLMCAVISDVMTARFGALMIGAVLEQEHDPIRRANLQQARRYLIEE